MPRADIVNPGQPPAPTRCCGDLDGREATRCRPPQAGRYRQVVAPGLSLVGRWQAMPNVVVESHLLRLREGLRAVLAERRVPAAFAAPWLGKSPGYFSRVLSGELEAKVSEVFEVLYHLEIPGDYFFACHFSSEGPAAAANPSPGLAGGLAPGYCDHWDGEIWCEWVRTRLLGLARERRVTLRTVARRVGRPEDSLSRALHGHTRLTFRLVFGVLAALGLPPWRFFLLATLPPGQLVPGVSWADLLELVGWAFDEEEAGRAGGRAEDGPPPARG